VPLNRVNTNLSEEIKKAVRDLKTVSRRIERNKERLLYGAVIRSNNNKPSKSSSRKKEDVATNKESGEGGGYIDREDGEMDL